jgi:mRNA interferase MazF
MSRLLAIGDIITARFPIHTPSGHEQEGLRPALVLGLPDKVASPRFSMVLLAPITTDRNQSWANSALYPKLGKAFTGLSSDSIVMLEQTRSLDAQRVGKYVSSLPTEVYETIASVLAQITDLQVKPKPDAFVG